LPELSPSLIIDILLSAIAGMLLFDLRKHIDDDNEAHKQLREDSEKRANNGDAYLDKRLTRIENYLNGKLK
jgi:hypothetical protein